jgi:CelD/BcsL family acetyltransferase involved in cellulose biosynthesis
MLDIQERQALFETGTGAAIAPVARADARALDDKIALSIFSDLDAIAEVWRGFEAIADCTAFQSFAWHAAWQRHIGSKLGVLPTIVIGRVRGRVVFILPFAIESGRFSRQLVWHASDLCDYNEPLLAPDFAAIVPDFEKLFAKVAGEIAEKTPFDAVLLTKMPDNVGAQKNPFLALPTTLNPSGAYLVNLGTDWESFYTAKRSSSTRRRDRTKRKRLGDIGAVSFATPDTDAGIRTNLATLLDQKGKAFAAMGVDNFLARREVRDFFTDLATNPEARDFVHVSHFDVGDQMAATNFGLVFRNRYYHVLASYDGGPASKFGPGAAHLHELMAYAMRRGCEAFDFTIGDERYKREWSDVVIALHDHRCAVTLRGFLCSLPGLAISEAKRIIKHNEVLWPLALRVRGMMFGRKAAKADEPAEED